MEEKETKKTEQVKEKKKPEKDEAKKENESLKAELQKAQDLSNEYKDKWMRSVAEFDNYKKRNANLYTEAFNDGKTDVILKILSVGDNLDNAMTFDLDEKTMEGIKLIKKKFDDTLKSMEVEEINPVGEKFDPNIAEAVMQVEEEGESDTVKQVFIKGYKLKDKIIRYAKVSVIK